MARTTLHEDTAGHHIPISANKLMMMNAGESFWHEERTPDEPVEMLQIFVRPNEADLPALVDFHDRPDGALTDSVGTGRRSRRQRCALDSSQRSACL